MNTSPWFVALVIAGVVLCVPDRTAGAQDVRAGVDQLADEIVKSLPPQPDPLRLAVADFPDLQGVTNDLGRYIANRLTTRLTQSPKFFVVERQRLGQVLAELKFSMSDLVDPAKAKQLGRMAGVQAIVVGTVSDLGNQVDVDVRVIEIETSRMLLSATTTISKDQVVAQLLESGRTVPAVTSGAGPSSNSPSGSPQTAAPGTGAYQEFPEFRLDIERVQIASSGEIMMFVVYTNKTQEGLSIGLCRATAGKTFLLDTRGNRYRYGGSSGIHELCDHFGGYLVLGPGMSVAASLTFRENFDTQQTNRNFSFMSEHLVARAGERSNRRSTHNVFIRNVEPR